MKITRRIGFYSLRVFQRADRSEILEPKQYIQDVLAYITQLQRANRRRETGDDRFYFLSDCNRVKDHPDTQKIVFKFANYGKLPPLIEKGTLSERPNTRQVTEGDRNRTHAVIRYFDDEAIVLLEDSRPAITIKQLVYYLRFFAGELHFKTRTKHDYDIDFSIIPKGDFLTELRNLRQVNVGTITISKRFIGSEGLDLSESLSEVQRGINLELKAKRNQDIKRLIEEIIENMVAPQSKVERLRIRGKNQKNQLVKLDTESIKMERILDFTPDPITGEVKTDEILNHLVEIIGEF